MPQWCPLGKLWRTYKNSLNEKPTAKRDSEWIYDISTKSYACLWYLLSLTDIVGEKDNKEGSDQIINALDIATGRMSNGPYE